jgi:ATP-binding cassette subfamily F protein 3
MSILTTTDISLSFGALDLFQGIRVNIANDSKIGLIGPNGIGKTSLMLILAGIKSPTSSSLHIARGRRLGYLRQEAVDAFSARSYLAGYLFRGDDVFKPISALSGGERGRLALALLALDGANFLLLDEPTNHLDLPAQEVLQEILQNFPGTILLVSHDRFLIDRLATQIWELREGRLEVFEGTYRQLILQRAEFTQQNRQVLYAARPQVRDNSNETRKRQQALSLLEDRIQEHEFTMQRLSKALQQSTDQQPYEHLQRLNVEFAQAQVQMEELMEEWEEAAI